MDSPASRALRPAASLAAESVPCAASAEACSAGPSALRLYLFEYGLTIA
ncbi:MAG: hypothetical protein JXA67_13570 [Micromonosporaceae bacterium]|nr:hypothetical protein [Micromonosporaceae bacterium]